MPGVGGGGGGSAGLGALHAVVGSVARPDTCSAAAAAGLRPCGPSAGRLRWVER